MDQVTQPNRFYDVASGGPVQVQIEQVGAAYRVVRQLGYRDPRYQEPFIVPVDVATFSTDLAWCCPGLTDT